MPIQYECEVWAEACDRCAGKCEMHDPDHYQQCAEACCRCAEACRPIVAAMAA